MFSYFSWLKFWASSLEFLLILVKIKDIFMLFQESILFNSFMIRCFQHYYYYFDLYRMSIIEIRIENINFPLDKWIKQTDKIQTNSTTRSGYRRSCC